MATKKDKGAGFEWAQACSTLVLRGKTYKLGDKCTGWTDEELEEYKFQIRPVKKK